LFQLTVLATVQATDGTFRLSGTGVDEIDKILRDLWIGSHIAPSLMTGNSQTLHELRSVMMRSASAQCLAYANSVNDPTKESRLERYVNKYASNGERSSLLVYEYPDVPAHTLLLMLLSGVSVIGKN
jgi:hypothetical protein